MLSFREGSLKIIVPKDVITYFLWFDNSIKFYFKQTIDKNMILAIEVKKKTISKRDVKIQNNL